MRHNECIVLETFAQALLDLHHALTCESYEMTGPLRDTSAYNAARAAVRAARMLTVKEEYR